MALSRDQILAANDRAIVTVAVPEWGGDVLLRPLSAHESTTLYDGNPEHKTLVNRLIAMSIVDDAGARLCPDSATADQLANSHSRAAFMALTADVMRINGYSKTAVSDAKKD